MAAWIDPSASFDPRAALRAGVDLDRLVVVRAKDPDEVLLAGSAVLRSEGFRLAVVDLGPSFASRCTVDDLAPLLPVVRGSPAALLVIAETRGRRVALPTVRVEPIGWQQRFGRTVGWSFARTTTRRSRSTPARRAARGSNDAEGSIHAAMPPSRWAAAATVNASASFPAVAGPTNASGSPARMPPPVTRSSDDPTGSRRSSS